MANVQSMIGEDVFERRQRMIIVFMTVCLWLLHLLPLLFPDGRMWGFNHLIFLPNPYVALFIGLGALALLFFVEPIKGRILIIYEKTADFCFAPSYRWRWAALALSAIPIFWIFRADTHFLGDGFWVINNIGGRLSVFFKWPEVGAIKTVFFISKLLPYSGSMLGEYTFAAVSVLSGAVTIFFFGCIAFEYVSDNATRLWIAAMSTFSGWILLFFGYAEHYPIIWPLVAAYLYFSIRYMKGKTALWAPTLMILAALALHLQILFFLLSYPVLIFSRGAGNKIYLRYRKIVWASAGMILIAGCIVFVLKWNAALEFRLFFVPLLHGRPGAPGYSMLSIQHLIDILNELLLVIPLLPVVAIISMRRIRGFCKDATDLFLLVFSLGGFLFLLSIDPKIGMGRDWDLFALAGLGPVLYLSRRFSHMLIDHRDCYPGLAAMALILTLPYLATNLKYSESITYMEWLLNKDVDRSRTGMQVMRTYYSDIGDQAKADSVENEIISRFPMAVAALEAYQLAQKGFFDQAMARARQLFENDPYSVESFNVRGYVYLRMGEYEKAAADFEQSRRLGGYDFAVYAYLAETYFYLGNHESMMKNFSRSYTLNSGHIPSLDGLAAGYLAERRYDSALYYSEKMIDLDSSIAEGYLMAGISAFESDDRRKARSYIVRYLELAPEGRDTEMAEALLRRMDREEGSPRR